MNKTALTQEMLTELMDYDPSTGIAVWKPRKPEYFKGTGQRAASSCSRWNKLYAGKPCGLKCRQGYLRVKIFGQDYALHRLIFVLYSGSAPDLTDHINGKRDDNRWVNLRSVDCATNNRNLARYERNTSGRTGIRLNKRSGKWDAVFSLDGHRRSISFDTKVEAIASRITYERILGYHQNHGRAK